MSSYGGIQNTAITGLFLSTIALFIRLLVKWVSVIGTTADDYSVVVAWLFSFITQITILYGLDHGGLGIHIALLDLSMIETYEKCMLLAACAFVMTATATRISHLLMFRRLLSPAPSSPLAVSLWVVGTLLTKASLVILGCLIFACEPIAKAWHVAQPGSCIDRTAIYITIAVVNIISDIGLTILASLIVLPLHLSPFQKSHVFGMMIIGTITMIISAVRLKMTVPLLHSDDPTFMMAPVALLVSLEANFAIATACLPSIRRGFQLLVTGSHTETILIA